MTLNDLIKSIPIDHHDIEILLKDDNEVLHKLEFTHITRYGMDTAKIILRIEK